MISLGASDCARCGWTIGSEPSTRRVVRAPPPTSAPTMQPPAEDDATVILKGGGAAMLLALVMFVLSETSYTLAVFAVPLPRPVLVWGAVILAAIGFLMIVGSGFVNKARRRGPAAATAPHSPGGSSTAVVQEHVPQANGSAPIAFFRQGPNLSTQLTVSSAQVASGVELPLTLPGGRTVGVRLHPVMQSGSSIRSNEVVPGGLLTINIRIID
jgi:hypothetical protein